MLRVARLHRRPAVLMMLCLAALLAACSKTPPPYRGTALGDVKWGRDFTLTASGGARLATKDLRGKALILYFGYSHCPDVCAPTLTKLAQLTRALGDDARRVQVLFVSVDPEHDDPAQLQKFLAGFDPSFVGLTGSADEVGSVAADHMVFFRSANGGRIEHTSMLFVKDVRGRMRLLIRDTASVDDLVHDLKLVLAE